MTAVCFIEVLFCRSEFASLRDFDFSPNAFCNPSVPIFWGSVWSESCLVGLVWCLDHRFSSFPCSVLAPSISDPATSGLGSPDSAFQTWQFASGIAGLQFKRWGTFIWQQVLASKTCVLIIPQDSHLIQPVPRCCSVLLRADAPKFSTGVSAKSTY
jgi:hypothetical protein